VKGSNAQYHLSGASAVMVLLSGALMQPRHMVDAGLFESVRQGGLALNLVATDLHADGVDNREALYRLETEWLVPARQKYQQVWLGGISRGELDDLVPSARMKRVL
jgi:hypothetical protein